MFPWTVPRIVLAHRKDSDLRGPESGPNPGRREPTRDTTGEGYSSMPPPFSGLCRTEICWYCTRSTYCVNPNHDDFREQGPHDQVAATHLSRSVPPLRR